MSDDELLEACCDLAALSDDFIVVPELEDAREAARARCALYRALVAEGWVPPRKARLLLALVDAVFEAGARKLISGP